jgi:hypothetical protein
VPKVANNCSTKIGRKGVIAAVIGPISNDCCVLTPEAQRVRSSVSFEEYFSGLGPGYFRR